MCAATALLGAAAAAADKAPLVIEPSSKWNIDYNDDSCRLGRKFGNGEQFMFFYLERFEPSDRFMMVVAGTPLGIWANRTTDFLFGPAGREMADEAHNGTHGSYGPVVTVEDATLLPLPDRDADAAADENAAPRPFAQSTTSDQERSVEWLELRPSGRAPIRLALVPMDKPMAAMRACTEELITLLGARPRSDAPHDAGAQAARHARLVDHQQRLSELGLAQRAGRRGALPPGRRRERATGLVPCPAGDQP